MGRGVLTRMKTSSGLYTTRTMRVARFPLDAPPVLARPKLASCDAYSSATRERRIAGTNFTHCARSILGI